MTKNQLINIIFIRVFIKIYFAICNITCGGYLKKRLNDIDKNAVLSIIFPLSSKV